QRERRSIRSAVAGIRRVDRVSVEGPRVRVRSRASADGGGKRDRGAGRHVISGTLVEKREDGIARRNGWKWRDAERSYSSIHCLVTAGIFADRKGEHACIATHREVTEEATIQA